MMQKRFQAYHLCSVIISVICPCTFLFLLAIPNASLSERKGLYFRIGVLFWCTVLLLLIFLILESWERRRMEKKKCKKRLPGILRFFSCKEAVVAEISIIVFAALLVVAAILQIEAYAAKLVCLVLLLISFMLHCVFNGKNHEFYKQLLKKGAKKK